MEEKRKPSAPAAQLPATLRALRHRNYRLFFGGQIVSLSGTWMQIVAQSWLVYRLTGSAALLGIVGFVGQIPVLLLATFGGMIADHYPRRSILLATQGAAMAQAAVLAALTLTGHVGVAHVMVLATLLGIVNAIDMPTRQSFVIDMVGRDDLVNAIALNSSVFNSARIIGPSLAGLLVASIGEGWCFFANAASYSAVLASLSLMRIDRTESAPRRGRTLARLGEGFRFARRARPVRALLLLVSLASLWGMPYIILMPIFADRILQGGPKGLGILMGSAGVGALFGALTLASRRSPRGLGRWVALAMGGFGVFLFLFSLSRAFWLSAALLVPAGFCMIWTVGAANTLIQVMVPDELRGRVMAIFSMMFLGIAPFGSLLAGALAERFGASATVAIGGVVCLAGAVRFAIALPGLRTEARVLAPSLRPPTE